MKKIFLKKVSLFIMLFTVSMSYGQGGTVRIANLKYTNGSAIPAGSAIEIYEGGTQSITFDLVLDNPNYILKYGSIYVYSEKTHLASVKTQYVNVDYSNSVTFPPYYSQQYTIVLDARSFNATGGNLFPQVVQVGYAPFEGTRIPVKVKPIPQITNNVISTANLTINEGNGSLLTGTLPSGGLGTGSYTYEWYRETSSGVWTKYTGINLIDFFVFPYVTTKIRRVVKSGNISHNSNTLTITVLPAPTLQNNVLTLNGSTISGTLPTGGINQYTYSWTLIGGEEPYIFPQTGQNFTITSDIYNYLNSYPGLFIIRTVTSGSQLIYSNSINIPTLTELQNNTINISGLQVSGSQPTGGNGEYVYTWLLSSTNDPIIFTESTKDLNLAPYDNAINILQTDQTAVLIRIVSSGNKILYSNFISLYVGRQLPTKENIDIKAYPNPTAKAVNFETNFEKDTDAEILIYNESGKSTILFKGNLKKGQVIEWNIPSDYSKGLYFYKISSGNQELKIGKILYQ